MSPSWSAASSPAPTSQPSNNPASPKSSSPAPPPRPSSTSSAKSTPPLSVFGVRRLDAALLFCFSANSAHLRLAFLVVFCFIATSRRILNSSVCEELRARFDPEILHQSQFTRLPEKLPPHHRTLDRNQ